MSPMTLICRTCGDACLLADDVMMRECPSCGTVICRPAEGDVSDMLSRATGQRLRCDFVHAENSYQYVLRESPEEHEALWGLVQCRYGVEYVKDPRTGKPVPIVHAVRRRPMLTDPDFREACDLAPEAVRAQYRQEAEYIDGAMARILDLAEKGEAYDVFLCHKTSRTDGEEGYTEDFKRATDLYIMLRELGYRVFFAPFAGLTPGENYEAGIYHALTTSKVMLVICSNADYINSPWVRTEWQRFLEMSYEDGADKHLIPLLYEGFSPRRLPDDFRQLQAITMGELNAKDSLVAAMEGFAGRTGVEAQVQEKLEPVPVQEVGKTSTIVEVEPTESADTTPAYTPESDFAIEAAEGGVCITKYIGPGGEVLIPPMIGGKKVVGIGTDAFMACVGLQHVVIPEGVTSIGVGAFRGCRALTSVIIPGGVTTIKRFVFKGCSNLRNVSIPEGVASIEDNAFHECRAMARVDMPCSVTSIGARAFCGCEGLKMVDIPNGVASIGRDAFGSCNSLVNVSIPASVNALIGNPFFHCKSLKKITVAAGNGMYYVKDNMLLSRKNELICCPAAAIPGRIPEGVKSIGAFALYGNKHLVYVTIPSSVENIGECAFGVCPDLLSVTILNGVRTIGKRAFYGCRNLENLKIPSSVMRIENEAFQYCENLPLLQKMELKQKGAM